mmetsp:Transcript_18279/g.36426  ORF Transcript_18279/g.36426 Transcript_18279/m.36426 type:complete len:213 (+) Transcript_18279:1843-2481(+)
MHRSARSHSAYKHRIRQIWIKVFTAPNVIDSYFCFGSGSVPVGRGRAVGAHLSQNGSRTVRAMSTFILGGCFCIILNHLAPCRVNIRGLISNDLTVVIKKVAAIDADSRVAHLHHLILPTDANLVQRKVHAVIVAINGPLNDPASLVVEDDDGRVVFNAAHKGMGSETLYERQHAADGKGRLSLHLAEQKPGFFHIKAEDIRERCAASADGN